MTRWISYACGLIAMTWISPDGDGTLTSTLMLREGTRVQENICAENNLDPANFEKLLKEGVQITR